MRWQGGKFTNLVYSGCYNSVIKIILSQSSDLCNGQIMYYLNICTFDLSFNLSYITIYITFMIHLLTIFLNKMNYGVTP